MLKADVTIPIVEDGIGEITVSFTNSTASDIDPLLLSALIEVPQDDVGALVLFPDVPRPSDVPVKLDLGWCGPGDTKVARFAVKNHRGRIGHTYVCKVRAHVPGPDEVRDVPLYIEASPEVYAVLGLAELARRSVHTASEALRVLGRQTARNQKLRDLPSSGRRTIFSAITDPGVWTWIRDSLDKPPKKPGP